MSPSYVVGLEDCRPGDVLRVGGKCASLGGLLDAGLPVPPGFAVTTDAFVELLATGDLGARIHAQLARLDTENTADLAARSDRIRAELEASPVPPEIDEAVRAAYGTLCATVAVPDVPVAVRSSATAEDLPGTSFAGQQDTYLWVTGAEAVLEHVRRCWSSLYTARAIAYRHDNGFPHEQVLMSVGVQKMVRARAAGVAMTLNPANGDRSKIVIDSSFGLGETVVGGTVTPDNFVVDKVIFEVVKRTISAKHVELVADARARRVVELPVAAERQREPSLSLEEVKAVARAAKLAEQHFRCPQDVEWALDPEHDAGGGVVLLQSRPETVWSRSETLQPTRDGDRTTGVEGVLSTLLNPLAARKKTS